MNIKLAKEKQVVMPFVLTVDGPSGAGKGTVCQRLAQTFNWHYLDSGAIYRVSAYAMKLANVSITELTPKKELADFIMSLDVEFKPSVDGGVDVLLNKDIINDHIRTEEHGVFTSKVSAVPSLREVLLEWQQSMATPPGLVADGRDMGTVVFPNANLKIFLIASAQERAKRRFNQLKNKGIDVNLSALIEEIKLRDYQDEHRAVSPMKPADDAIVIDSTNLSIDEVLAKIVSLVE